jgi:hypothetical protein
MRVLVQGCEVVQEVSQQAQWAWDVAWSPRVPGLLAAASFDTQLALHSLLATDRPEIVSASLNPHFPIHNYCHIRTGRPLFVK